MADINEDKGIPDSRRGEALHIDKLQRAGRGYPMCGKFRGHKSNCDIFQPSQEILAQGLLIDGPCQQVLTDKAEAKFTATDKGGLYLDKRKVDQTLTTPVSDAVRKECDRELSDAKKRGYRLLDSQKKPPNICKS